MCLKNATEIKLKVAEHGNKEPRIVLKYLVHHCISKVEFYTEYSTVHLINAFYRYFQIRNIFQQMAP